MVLQEDGTSATRDVVAATQDSTTAERLFPSTPLTALGVPARMQLSEMLNYRKVLRHCGYHRDWRGLAELANVRSFCNDHNDDPMHSVLTQWCTHNRAQATFFHLLDFLAKIDRWDVCDDIHAYLVKDALHYDSNRPHTPQTTLPEIPCTNNRVDDESDSENRNATPANPGNAHAAESHTDSSSDDDDDAAPEMTHSNDGGNDSDSLPDDNAATIAERLEALTARMDAITSAQQASAAVPAPAAAVAPIEALPEPAGTSTEIVESVNPLTRQDAARLRRGLPLEQYDAFVLYDEADQQYAKEMQTTLEQNTEYNFRLVFKNRDLLGGTFFTDAVTELIENRCRYLLLILTKNFYREYENFFFINNTAALQISENSRRIIPLLYDFTKVRALRGVHMLKYGGEGFWGKLADSISIPRATLVSFNEKTWQHAAATPNTPPPAASANNVNNEKLITEMAVVKLPERKSKKKPKSVIGKVRDWTLQKS